MAERNGLLSSLFRRSTIKPTQRQGSSGTAIYGGYVVSSEKDSRLQGRERYISFSNLLANVSIVGAGVRHILDLVSAPSWKAQPPRDSGAEGERLAQLTLDILHDMETPWRRVVRRTSKFKFDGFHLEEWIAKRRPDGVIGLQDIEARPAVTIERWDCDDAGVVRGVAQRSAQTGEELYLPRGKLIYALDDALNDSPEGLGLFRHLVEPAERLVRFQQLEAFGFETDLRGVPLGRAPLKELQERVAQGELSEAQALQLLFPLTSFIEKHIKGPQLGLLLDSQPYESQDDASTPSPQRQWDLNLMSHNSGESSAQVHVAIERITREMARIIGVEHLLLGGDGKGSLALSSDKTEKLALMIRSILTELSDVFSKDVVDPLWMLNGWPDELKPCLKANAVQFRDVEQITRALSDLAQAGAPLPSDSEAIAEIFELLGLKPPDLDAFARDAMIRLETNTTNGSSFGTEEDEA